MNLRPLRMLCAGFTIVIYLTACGGGSSSTATSTSTQSAPATTAATAPAAAPKHHASGTDAKTEAQRRAAGRAAPFVKPEADNSVPTFGSEASAAERAGAEATLKAYLGARARADWAAACRRLAAPTRQGYEKLARSSSKAKAGDCAAVLAALSKGADLSDPLTGRLLSLRIHGANAFALFYGPGHQQYMVPMNREGGAWRPTQATPIAYPPGAATTTSP